MRILRTSDGGAQGNNLEELRGINKWGFDSHWETQVSRKRHKVGREGALNEGLCSGQRRAWATQGGHVICSFLVLVRGGTIPHDIPHFHLWESQSGMEEVSASGHSLSF